MRKIITLIILSLLLAACGAQDNAGSPMMDPGGMGARHHAQMPSAYADLTSPSVTDAMLTRGNEIYASMCVSCHGDKGLGDGPAASALDPAPAPVSHTSQMLGDGYLYWRVYEGGTPFGSAMPAWGSSLSEEDIWSVIAYMRILGGPEAQAFAASRQNEMLSAALERGLITQAEADTFSQVHDLTDAYLAEHQSELPPGSHEDDQAYVLGKLVEDGGITQAQADDFTRIHQLLLDNNLMQ